LSDVDRQVGAAYDVVRPDGDPYPDFPKRMSYLIDPDGVIQRVYNVTDVAGHAGEVLDDLHGLQTPA
jgi:peroxiredoxin